MSKGSVVIKLLVFIIALVFIGIVNQFILTHKEFQIVKKGLTETAIIEAANKMEFLKKSLQQALTYSYYQTSYEVAKNGGYEQTALTWRKYDDISKFPNFKETLVKKLLSIFNLYVNDIRQTGITIDSYQNGEIVKENNNLENVSASSNANLEISTAIYRLVNKGIIFVQVPIRTLTLFDMGKSEFVDKDSLQPKIQNAEQLIPNQCRQIVKSTCENNLDICESELTNKCGDIDNKFGSDVDKGIDSFKHVVNNFETDIVSKEIKATHITSSNVVFGNPDLSCACKPGKSREVPVEKPCPEPDNPEKKCPSTEEVCDEYYRTATVTCNYAYFASAKIGVKILDKNDKYPVYDGNVDMRNIQLNFNVISGNDYSQKLIQ